MVKATIVLARGYEPSPELTKELQTWVKHETAPYKYPRIVEYVDELPKTIGGKINLAEAGCFDDMDAAVQIHIGSGSGAYVGGHALALNGIEVTYHGVSSHAAGAPERGVNALDAAYLTFDGVNALRQHVTPDVRMHGVIINGGLAPNVVPALAVSRWEVRAAERAMGS